MYHYFHVKKSCFSAVLCRILFQHSHNWSNFPEQAWCMVSQIPSIKSARWYLPRIRRNEFFKKSATKFPTLHHLTSRCEISMTVTSNWARLGPMETRHLDLSRDIKFEEIRAWKGLQTAAQRSNQNQEKDKISKLGEQVGTWCHAAKCAAKPHFGILNPINTPPPLGKTTTNTKNNSLD